MHTNKQETYIHNINDDEKNTNQLHKSLNSLNSSYTVNQNPVVEIKVKTTYNSSIWSAVP